jgi:putative heme transporter
VDEQQDDGARPRGLRAKAAPLTAAARRVKARIEAAEEGPPATAHPAEIRGPAPDGAERAPRPRRPVDSVSWGLRIAAEWSARWLIVIAAVYVLFLLLNEVRLVAFGFVVALLLTALLYPLVARLVTVGVHRTLATLLVLLLGLTALGLVGWFVTDQVSKNASSLAAQLQDAGDEIRTWLVNGPLHLNDQQLSDLIHRATSAITRDQGSLMSRIFATASTAAEAVAGILLVIFTTFFLLRDGRLVWAWAVRLFPEPSRVHVNVAGGLGWQTLSGYVRGIVIVALTDAISITIVLLVVGVPLAVPLGVLVFIGAFVPLVGLMVAGTLCVLVTLISHGLGAALIVAVAIVLLVQAEGHLLHPLVMSRAVRIHPLAVVLAVTAGTLVAGIEGALIAVPLVAVVNSIGGYLRSVPSLRDAGGPPDRPEPERSPDRSSTADPAAPGSPGPDRSTPDRLTPDRSTPDRSTPDRSTPAHSDESGRAAPAG